MQGRSFEFEEDVTSRYEHGKLGRDRSHNSYAWCAVCKLSTAPDCVLIVNEAAEEHSASSKVLICLYA